MKAVSHPEAEIQKVSITDAVQQLQFRTVRYEQAAKGLASLVSSGLARAVPLESGGGAGGGGGEEELE